MSLSDKIILVDYESQSLKEHGVSAIKTRDVREAVKELKKVIRFTYEEDDLDVNRAQIDIINDMLQKQIDEIFGEKLI